MSNDIEITRRIQLQNLLESILGSSNVYYKPPENIKLEYPCIKYSRINIDSIHADNVNYRKTNRYQIIVIDKKIDNPAIEKLLELPMSSFDRHYVSDNLNHDVIVLYF